VLPASSRNGPPRLRGWNPVRSVPFGFPCAPRGPFWNARPTVRFARRSGRVEDAVGAARQALGRAFQDDPGAAHGKPEGTAPTAFGGHRRHGPCQNVSRTALGKPQGTSVRISRPFSLRGPLERRGVAQAGRN